MGRIRDNKLKKYAKEIVEKFPDKVSLDFEENKAFLNENFDIYSKKLRNKLAGYIITWINCQDNTYEDVRRLEEYNKTKRKTKKKGKQKEERNPYT